MSRVLFAIWLGLAVVWASFVVLGFVVHLNGPHRSPEAILLDIFVPSSISGIFLVIGMILLRALKRFAGGD